MKFISRLRHDPLTDQRFNELRASIPPPVAQAETAPGPPEPADLADAINRWEVQAEALETLVDALRDIVGELKRIRIALVTLKEPEQ